MWRKRRPMNLPLLDHSEVMPMVPRHMVVCAGRAPVANNAPTRKISILIMTPISQRSCNTTTHAEL